LSQAYGFAKQSGGSLALESKLGEGTTVTFYLPVAKESGRAAAPEPQPEPRLPPINAAVLVVEDDASVADLALSLLEEAGYRVTCVPSAEAALAYLRKGGKADILFSDIVMPGSLNGVELAQVVRKEFPALFVLLATGYAEAAAGQMANEFPLIQKPYDRQTLLATMGKILGEGD
jgi:CheY-like chemotaxis protein